MIHKIEDIRGGRPDTKTKQTKTRPFRVAGFTIRNRELDHDLAG